MGRLKVDVYSRGKEVYGLTEPSDKFDKKLFLSKHKDDYYELSGDTVESEVEVNESFIFIELDDEQVCHEEYKDGHYWGSIKVSDSGRTESYRELLRASESETAVVWFHDYENTKRFIWENVKQFDPSKLLIYTMNRLDEAEGAHYGIISHATYDGNDPDGTEMDGTPKHGYWGPFVV